MPPILGGFKLLLPDLVEELLLFASDRLRACSANINSKGNCAVIRSACELSWAEGSPSVGPDHELLLCILYATSAS